MFKKYQAHTTQLSAKEMKEIKGGMLAPQAYRYVCTEGGGLYTYYYCAYESNPPHPVCGHEVCTKTTTCSPVTFNGINCQ